MGPHGGASSSPENPENTMEFKAEEPDYVSPRLALLEHQWEKVDCAVTAPVLTVHLVSGRILPELVC